jgi:hypothetical protein
VAGVGARRGLIGSPERLAGPVHRNLPRRRDGRRAVLIATTGLRAKDENRKHGSIPFRLAAAGHNQKK